MKSRHIRKLRKRLQEYQTYIVITSSGAIFPFNEKHGYKVKASGCIHAIERYMKYYWRKHKFRNKYYRDIYHEVYYDSGNLCVINQKNYKRYYI